MNFQAVEAANGKNVTMFGTFVDVDGPSYSANQKAKAVCKVRDMTGISHNVHIYQGKGYLPGPQNINQRCEFTLKMFRGSGQGGPYTSFSGFWNPNAQVPQQQAPQQGQQGLQQPAQQPNSKKDVDWDAKDLRMARECALKSATSLVCTLAELTQKSIGLNATGIKGVAELFVDYIYNGNRAIPDPDSSIQEPQYSPAEGPWDPENLPQNRGDDIPI